jgi:hypothetical protein
MFRAAALLVLLAAASPMAAAITASHHKEPVPGELAPSVTALLSSAAEGPSAGVRAVVGGVTLDFWWVKALAAKDPANAWRDMPEGTLVGAVRVGADFRDIRGRVIKPGVYTLRYGLQPANGDHLGVSPFRDFLLLSPAAIDKDPAAPGHDGTIELSKQSIGGSHPGVWSLDPPVAPSQAPLSLHKTDLEHEAVVVEVATGAGGSLKFGIVLVGKIEA